MPKNIRRLQEAQLHSASGRSSKIIKAVVEVAGRGTLTLSVHSGGAYSLRAGLETDERGQKAAGRDLVAVGVLGGEEVVSMVPG